MSGGKREGAGRPPIDPQLVKIPVGYKLPRWLVGWMRGQDTPASQLIEDALKKRHKLKPPEGAQRKVEGRANLDEVYPRARG